MSDKTWSIAGWVVAIVMAVVGYLIYSQKDARKVADYKAHASAQETRVKAGPHVESDKAVSDTENVKVVLLPHRWGEYFDQRCVVYTNRALKTSAMSCFSDSVSLPSEP